MRIFITGITGLLGTNLAHELIGQGHQITAIVRDPAKYIGNLTGNLHLVKMSLSDDYDDHLRDADIVVHIAAETATHLLRYSDYEKINYDATVRLFEKAIDNSVPKFIFISTANTIGHGNENHPGNETHKIKKPFNKLFYAQSKLQAEKYLVSRSNAIDVKILNPTFMIGANDSKPSSGKILLMGMDKRLVFYPPGGKNFVAVKDVVNAIISCFQNGNTGERYLIAGENLSYRDFFKKLSLVTGQSPYLIPVPKLILQILGLAGSCLRAFKISTSLNLVNIQILCTKNFYSNNKSGTELKMLYSPLEDAIKEGVHFFRNTTRDAK